MGGYGGFGGLGIGNPGSYGGEQSVGAPGFSGGYGGDADAGASGAPAGSVDAIDMALNDFFGDIDAAQARMDAQTHAEAMTDTELDQYIADRFGSWSTFNSMIANLGQFGGLIGAVTGIPGVVAGLAARGISALSEAGLRSAARAAAGEDAVRDSNRFSESVLSAAFSQEAESMSGDGGVGGDSGGSGDGPGPGNAGSAGAAAPGIPGVGQAGVSPSYGSLDQAFYGMYTGENPQYDIPGIVGNYTDSLERMQANPLNVQMPDILGGANIPLVPGKWANFEAQKLFPVNQAYDLLSMDKQVAGQIQVANARKPDSPSFMETVMPAVPGIIDSLGNMDWSWLNSSG